MFGNKKMYKKGLADAMTAYDEFGKKQENALSAIRQEVREGKKQLEEALAGLGDELNGIYNYLDAKEKAALYHLNTPYDIKALEDSEQRLLLAILYQLAENTGSSLNDYQRTYIRGVQRYLEITNPQVGIDDLSVVGEIDSGIAQKAILQTVMEFFYLQDSDELTEAQDEFLDEFSVNKKQALAIEGTVSRLYNAVGEKGLSEKYGNDEVIQQAKNQALEAFSVFEEKADSSYLHIYEREYSKFFINVSKEWSNIIRSAYIDSDCYKDKSKCQNDAERQLERYYREAEKNMSSYMKRYGDNSILKRISDTLDARIKYLSQGLPQMRTSRTGEVLDKIGTYLSKTKVLDELSKNRISW